MINTILIYNSNEPLPEQGGMERVTDLLAKELQIAGNNIILLYSVPNRLQKEYLSPVPIFRVPEENPQKFILDLIKDHKIDIVIDQAEGRIVGPYGYFKSRPKEMANLFLLAVQHSSRRAVLSNIVHIFGKAGNDTLGKIIAWTFNNTILKLRYLHFLWVARKVHKNLDKNYDRTIVLSQALINDFAYYYSHARKDKVIAIPNPNTYESDELSCMEKRVLFVGRVNNNPKGVDKLLRIWSSIEAKFPDWKLDIVGDGEDRAGMEYMARELNLTNVVFHGFKNPQPFYRRASILCMTSLYEGFPMVLNEAMVHGIVPVVFKSFGAAEDIVVNGECGFLIKPFDEIKFADKLSYLMESKDALLRMSQNARTHSQLFTRDNVRNMWLKLFESLTTNS